VVIIVFAVLLTFVVPSYKNMVLDRKINATTAEIIDLINLAKNTAITKKINTAICASDGANNCIHTNDFTKNGANLVLSYYQTGASVVEKVEVGREKVIDDQNSSNPNNQQAAQARLDAKDPVLNKIFDIYVCATKSHKNVISGLYTQGECNQWNISKKKNNVRLAPSCHNAMKKYELMYGYALGYLDFDDSIQDDFLDKFVPNGKGVYSNVRVDHTGRYSTPYDWKKTAESKADHHYLNTWKAVNGSGSVSYEVKPIRDYQLGTTTATNLIRCPMKDNVAAVINNVKKVISDAPAPNTPQVKYKEKIIYEERVKNIPSELVFNPKQNEKGKFVKDENGNYVPSDEDRGVIYRLNSLANTAINVTSNNKTLIFSPNNAVSKINDVNNNEIVSLQGYAVITVHDNKRGIGKQSKQICVSVLGVTKVITGDKTCDF